MAADLRPLEIYSAGGIDQSEKPRPDSVLAACNIDTSKGLWAARPGWAKVKAFDTGYTGADPFFKLLTEYIPDSRYATSHYYAVIMAHEDNTGVHRWFEFNEGGTTTLATPVASTPGGEHQLTEADCLWRDVNNPDIDFWYVPVKVFSNGYDPPVFYHQKSPDGIGMIEELDAVDGGDSSLSYLTEPPKAKVYVIYKDRLFAFNVPGGGNVGYNTGLYGFATYVCNVWPAGYNFSIGTGSDIVGAKVLNGVLYIFKKREIWALSGDGIDGNWQLELVDREHGAFNNRSIVDTGDALVFIGGMGEAIYRFDGNRVVNISHPRLQRLWKEYNWNANTRQGKNVNGVFDEAGRRIIFVVNQPGHPSSTFSYGMLSYNLDTDTWDRWGDWPGHPVDKTGFNMPYNNNVMPVILMGSKGWYGDRSAVMGISHIYDRGEGYMCTLKGSTDMHILSTSHKTIPPHWYIRTHKYFSDDSYSKMLEQMMVYAKMTGDWNLTILALKDDETIEQAIRRGSGDQHNIIEDSENLALHLVAGTCQFNLVADGPVDVIHLPTLHKLFDSRVLVANSTVDKIQFAATLDSRYLNSRLLVLKEDKVRVKLVQMYESGDPILDAAGTTWGDAKWKSPQFKRLTRGENVEGRCFSLYLSNVGSYHSTKDIVSEHWAAPSSGRCEIKGWGLWVRRHGVMTQQKRTFEMPSY